MSRGHRYTTDNLIEERLKITKNKTREQLLDPDSEGHTLDTKGANFIRISGSYVKKLPNFGMTNWVHVSREGTSEKQAIRPDKHSFNR